MKFARRFLFLLALAALRSALPGQTAPAEAPAETLSPYAKSVQDYVGAAQRQLDAYQVKVTDGLKDDANKQRYLLPKLKLAECYDLLAKLRAADEPHFDGAKADFEKALQRLIALVRQAETP